MPLRKDLAAVLTLLPGLIPFVWRRRGIAITVLAPRGGRGGGSPGVSFRRAGGLPRDTRAPSSSGILGAVSLAAGAVLAVAMISNLNRPGAGLPQGVILVI